MDIYFLIYLLLDEKENKTFFQTSQSSQCNSVKA